MHLSLSHVHASLGGTRVIRDVSLEARESAFIGLIGPNGAGKTTLVRAVAALIPHEGAIELDGRAVAAMEPRARARAIAYLAQGAGSHRPHGDRRAARSLARRALLRPAGAAR